MVEDRIVGGYMSYWVYQHIGNLSPDELAEDETYQAVTRPKETQPRSCGSSPSGPKARTRARAGALPRHRPHAGDHDGLTRGQGAGPGRRSIFDDDEWDWIVDKATGDFDHLVIGSSLPFLFGQGMHYLEAWNEAVCDGAWGGAGARLGERVRRSLDLEHWAAFRSRSSG